MHAARREPVPARLTTSETVNYAPKLPDNWIKFNSVGRCVAPELVRRWGKDGSIPHRLCFRVLGMGDVNGCAIAQAVHGADAGSWTRRMSWSMASRCPSPTSGRRYI